MTRRLSVLYLSVFLAATLASATAQTVSFGLTATYPLWSEPELLIEKLETRSGQASLRLAGGIGGPLELGLSARETTSFGPVGNLSVYGEGQLATDGAVDVAIGAEGVVASVAAAARLELFTVDPGRFRLEDAFAEEVRPFFFGAAEGFGAGLALDARYRLQRNLILSAAPALYVVDDAGWGFRLATDLRLAKLVGPDDLSILGQIYLEPTGRDFAALGLVYTLNRRDLPSLRATLSLGYDGIFQPGTSLALSKSWRDFGGALDLSLAAEPYRSDTLSYRGTLSYEQTFSWGSLRGSLYAGHDEVFALPSGLELRYSRAF